MKLKIMPKKMFNLKPYLICLLGLLLISNIVVGQSNQLRSVFSNGATNAQGGAIRLQGTIGQSLIGPMTGNGTLLNQGFWARSAQAFDLLVTNGNNSGIGSLRAAIECASSGDTITFDFDGTVLIDSSEILIDKALTIDARGRDITLDANNNSRIFMLSADEDVFFYNLNFINGFGDFGGAMRVNARLTAINCSFSNNNADNGGALDVLRPSTFINCRFTDNTANFQSGAVQLFFNDHTFINCLFADNQAGTLGGVSMIGQSRPTFTNCTMFGNSAQTGGALFIASTAGYVLENSILFGNSAPLSPEIFIDGTPSVNNQANNNIVSDLSGSDLVLGVNNIISIDPLLRDPQNGDYGLQPFSPAHGNADPTLLPIDSLDIDEDGDSSETIDFDIALNQRGLANTTFDLGAFETAQGSLTVINADDAGIGSLRQALENANANVNLDFIQFDIPGDGPHEITLASQLPDLLDESIVVDGTSQPGSNTEQPAVTISGNDSIESIFSIRAPNCSILGLRLIDITGSRLIQVANTTFATISANTLITNQGQDHIALFSANNCTIASNRIGVDTNGVTTTLSRLLVYLTESSNNRILFNTFAGAPNNAALFLDNSSMNNQVEENRFGIDADGNPLPGGSGIIVQNSSSNNIFNNQIANNTVGVEMIAGLGNRISENDFLCNLDFGIKAPDSLILSPPSILANAPGVISGQALPNAEVEIYLQDDSACPNTACQGLFQGRTTADGSGNWSYNSAGIPEGATLTAIQIESGNTSAFADCSVIACTLEAFPDSALITCLDTVVTLEAFANQNDLSYSWSGPNGFTASTQSIVVGLAGDYLLTVMDSLGCTAQATSTVSEDITAPTFSVLITDITCITPLGQINVSSSDTIINTISWTGPNGFSSSNFSNGVDAPGEYFFTIEAPNGCTSSSSVLISEDSTTAPIADFDISITGLSAQFTNTSVGGNISSRWLIVNDQGGDVIIESENATFDYTTAGTKTVSLATTNQCGRDTSTQTFEISFPSDPIELFFLDTVKGASGTIIDLPILVTNFNDVGAMQFTLELADPSIARIVGTTGYNLSELTDENFSFVNDGQVNFSWNNGFLSTLEDSATIFAVQIELLGTTNICSNLQIGSSIVPLEIGVLAGNTILPAPVTTGPGNFCILTRADITGKVFRENRAPLKDVEVAVTPTMRDTTDTAGDYGFMGLATGFDYTLRPFRNTNPLEGVTTIDLVLIQRHLLAIEVLNSPYKIISADVNNSTTVSALDLVEIRRLILGITNIFPNNVPSWAFVPAAYQFVDPLDPLAFGFPDTIPVNNLLADVSGADFIGMKKGDVNGTAQGRPFAGNLAMTISETNNGKKRTIEFKAAATTTISAYQFDISFDPVQMRLLDILPGDLPGLNESFFHPNSEQEGLISTLWYDPTGALEGLEIEEGQVLFSFEFQVADQAETLEKRIWTGERRMPALGFNEVGDLLEVKTDYQYLVNNTLVELESPTRLEAIAPNPFKEEAQISFYLPNSQPVSFTVIDALGRKVKTVQANYGSGHHNWRLNANELNGPGWYTVEMRTEDFMERQRVILQR